MGFKFNPFSGNFDQTGSGGGGGASYIDGEVQNFSALPQTVGSPAVDSAYLVREAEGTWLLSRKPAGIYIRTANTGTRASDWTYAGEFPDVFNDANFVLYDDADSTKNAKFQLSSIATGTTRTITVPNKNVTLDDAGDSRNANPHAASHAAAGSDPLAPSDIGAQSLFTPRSQALSADVTLTSGRAIRVTLENYNGTTYNVTLPTTGNQTGDVFIIRTGTLVASQTIRRENFSGNFTTLATISQGQSYRFITTGTTSGSWQIDPVFTHTHAASDITSGTLDIARIPTGTSSTQVSLGNHGHGNINSSGQIGSTAGLPVVTTTAGAVTTLALGTANQVLRVNSGATGVEFADPAASGVTGAASSASDVLGVSGANITGVDANADRIVFWDDSASALKYLEAGSGLTISGTVMTASGGASINQAIAVGFVLN